MTHSCPHMTDHCDVITPPIAIFMKPALHILRDTVVSGRIFFSRFMPCIRILCEPALCSHTTRRREGERGEQSGAARGHSMSRWQGIRTERNFCHPGERSATLTTHPCFVCLCFLILTMCDDFYDTICIFRIYIYVRHAYMYIFQTYIYIFPRLYLIYMTHTSFYTLGAY